MATLSQLGHSRIEKHEGWWILTWLTVLLFLPFWTSLVMLWCFRYIYILYSREPVKNGTSMDVYLDDFFCFPFCKVLHSVDVLLTTGKTLEETTRRKKKPKKKVGKYVTLVGFRQWGHQKFKRDCVFFLEVDLYRYSYIDEHAKKASGESTVKSCKVRRFLFSETCCTEK